MRDFWEPAEPGAPSEEAGQATLKMPDTNPLRFFSSLQARFSPAAAGNGMMFASAGGGGASGYNPVQGGSDYSDDVETPATRGGRGDQGDVPAGRQRTVHYQPEERYWTDYLRIALPVIGLVLMLGLFWYWASTFIGGPSKKEPVATQSAGQAVLNNAASPTAAATRPAVIPPPKTPAANTGAGTPATATKPATANNTTGGGDNQANTNGGATNAQATQPASGTKYAAGDTVTTTDSVNLRSGPSTNDSALTTLNAGDSLTIVSGPEAGDSYQWYQVKTSDGTEGWVASDFIQKAGQ